LIISLCTARLDKKGVPDGPESLDVNKEYEEYRRRLKEGARLGAYKRIDELPTKVLPLGGEKGIKAIRLQFDVDRSESDSRREETYFTCVDNYLIRIHVVYFTATKTASNKKVEAFIQALGKTIGDRK
jgi:hypothetical protein